MEIKKIVMLCIMWTGLFTGIFVYAADCVNPVTIGGLKMRLDADDSEMLTLDITGNVQERKDKSGNGNHMTQSNPGARPTTKSNAINNRRSVVFPNAYAAWLWNTGVNIPQPTTVIMVARLDDKGSGYGQHGQWIFGSQDAAMPGRLSVHTWEGELQMYGGTSQFFLTIKTPLPYSIYRTIYSGGNGYFSKNGSGQSSGVIGNGGFSGFLISRTSFPYNMSGEITEVLVFDRSLSLLELSGVESYLASKYDLSSLDRCTLLPNLLSYIVGYGTQRRNVTLQNFNYGTARINNIAEGGAYIFSVNFINNLGTATSNAKLYTPFKFIAPVVSGIVDGGTGNITYQVKFFTTP